MHVPAPTQRCRSTRGRSVIGRPARSQDPLPERERRGVRARRRADRREQLAEPPLDGRLVDPELAGDLGVRLALRPGSATAGRPRSAARRPRRPTPRPCSIGPASATISRPSGPRSQRTRTSSSIVRCAIIASEICTNGRTPSCHSGAPVSIRTRAPGSRTSRCRSSCIAAWSAPAAARANVVASFRRSRERAPRSRAPRRPGRPRARGRGASTDRSEASAADRSASAISSSSPSSHAQPRRLDRQARERLASRGRQARVGRLLHGALQVRAHAGGVTGGRIRDPPPGLEPARTERARDARWRPPPRGRSTFWRRSTSPRSRMDHRGPAGGQELEVRIADLLRVSVGLSRPSRAPGRGSPSRARTRASRRASAPRTPRARSSFVNAFILDVSRRISSMCRAELVPRWMSGAQFR